MHRERTRRDVLRAVGVGTLGGGLASTGAAGSGRTAGSAQTDDSVEIATVQQLQAIRDDLGGDYVLVEDVDASGFDFDPIGDVDDPFVGTFDGNNHVISGLEIGPGAGDYVGLFRAVGSRDASSGGIVENVTLQDVDVGGNTRVGGLVGVNSGSISDATVTGSVTGAERVGGVVGANGGCIWRLQSATAVTTQSVAGGLVGLNNGYVAESSATGNVEGETEIGGLVGNVSQGIVTQSSATGDVTGTVRVSTNVGGLVGTLGGKILGSTAEGSVSGYDAVGGLVGYGSGGSVVLTSSAAASAPLVGGGDPDVVTNDHPSLGGSDRVAWWYQTYTGDRVSASPTVVDGTVHVGSFDDMGNCEPNVYAIDAATGDQDWELDTEANGTRTAGLHHQNSYVRTSAANVVDGTAYVKVPGRGLLLAMDAETSQEQWRAEMEWEGHAGSPTRYGDTVYALDGEWLYWFDAETGEERRRRAIEDPGASVVVADGTVYAYDRNDGLRAIDVHSGDTVWTFGGLETPIRHSAPAVSGVSAGGGGSSDSSGGGTVYTAGREATLYAVDAATGDQRWSTQLAVDGTPDPPRTTPTVAGGTVFFGSRSGRVYAVDAATGDVEWSYLTTTANSVHAAPTVVGDTVFVGSDDDHLYALDAASGTENWSFEARGGVRSAPVVVDGVVYFGSTEGYVYAVEADVDGSSEDSRVLQGTLGHHDAWTQQDDVPRLTAGPTETSGTGPTETPGPTTGPTRTPTVNQQGGGTTGGQQGADTATPTSAGVSGGGSGGGSDGGTGASSDDDGIVVEVPGPGIAGALGSILGASYLLGQRTRDDTSEDDRD